MAHYELLNDPYATSIVLGICLIISIGFISLGRLDKTLPDCNKYHRLGLKDDQTNLASQYSKGHGPEPGHPPRVNSLHIYPVKSCRGIELARSRVLPSGLEYDRLYTFAQLSPPSSSLGKTDVDTEETWQFLTQRQLPLLANVNTEIWLPVADGPSRSDGHDGEGFILVTFPWNDRGMKGLLQWVAAKVRRGWKAYPMRHFTLPLPFPSDEAIKTKQYTYANVKIWKETTPALNFENDLPTELAYYLGVSKQLGLFRLNPKMQRKVFRCAPREEEAGFQPVVDFHDAYPLHMLNLSSIQDLETRVEKDSNLRSLDARRFRSNIIVTGAEEYDEETWKAIKCTNPQTKSACSFDVSCRTVRCKMPNVDPATGIRHAKEPDFSLRKYRDVDEGAPKMGCLGMQLCPLFPGNDEIRKFESHIEVGMDIEVLKRGSHLYIKQ